MGNKFLITGGAGFIGREVVKQLLRDNHQVVVIDNLSFGSLDNIEEFKSSTKFKFYHEDIQNYDSIKDIIALENPNVAIHLAALHYIPYCNKHPEETLNVNVTATYQLFSTLHNIGIEKILTASSGAVYASTENELEEKDDTPQPVDIYGLSKLLDENICDYFSRNFDLKITAMRFFNTYGPYETNPHLIPEIIKQLKQDNYKVMLGNITTKRDYIYVEDIASAICLLSSVRQHDNLEIVNIGTGKEYSAKQIIQTLEKLLSKRIDIVIDEKRVRNNDKMHQIASTKRISELVNWKPKSSLEEGLRALLIHEKIIP